MPATRTVAHVLPSRPTTEGAGVHLRRAFGFGKEHLFDPFLMLDDFRGDDPAQYSAGFPWHPHRGIETITYMLDGEVEHGDSMGNEGRIGPGDVQWMTAGSGVIHQEMPEGDSAGRMGGFQLWANLPATHKMIDPRYCGISAEEIPVVETDEARVRVVCGQVGEVSGPVTRHRHRARVPRRHHLRREDLDAPHHAGPHGVRVPLRRRGVFRARRREGLRRERHRGAVR